MGYSGLGYKYRFSSGEREKIEGVLAWKWGIQSHLHVDHNYRNVQPTSNTCPNPPDSVGSGSTPKSPESFDVGAIPVPVTSLHVTDEKPNPVTSLVAYKVVLTDLSVSTYGGTKELEMLWVEPGTFTMGSPTSETGRIGNETQRTVTITQGFYLGKYEVTQAQYEAVMTGNTEFNMFNQAIGVTPSYFGGNPDRPVDRVSWADIQVFLTRLNAQEADNIPGWEYVLPTEAQWEYCCRAGTTTVYSWGDTITTDNANYSSSGYYQTRDVGLYDANPWGFYDMHGNLWEWAADAFANFPSVSETDPFYAGSNNSDRVLRGGSWSDGSTRVRSAMRSSSPPAVRVDVIGFRVALKKVKPKPPTSLNVNNEPGPVTSLAASIVIPTADLSISTYDGTKEMEMIWVEPGTFTMGQNGLTPNIASPEHEVTLTRPFYLGKYEVTQAQYEAVMTGNTDGVSPNPWNNPSWHSGDHPALNVTWNDVQVFLARLNAQEADNLPPGWLYALPTEAEWEYCCRAGTTTNYSYGDEISYTREDGGTHYYANFSWTFMALGPDLEVGTFTPNQWGFYDMHGNVWEWVSDGFNNSYPSSAAPRTDPWTDPANTAYPDLRNLRGGGFNSGEGPLASAYRHWDRVTEVENYIGFRVALKRTRPIPVSSIGVTAS